VSWRVGEIAAPARAEVEAAAWASSESWKQIPRQRRPRDHGVRGQWLPAQCLPAETAAGAASARSDAL